MHEQSGKIYDFANTAEMNAAAKKHGLVPIPAEDANGVRLMNRKQRRAWAAKQRAKKP